MSLRLRDYADNTDRMQAMMDLPRAPVIVDARETFDPAQAVGADMDDGAVTLPGAQYPAVGTVALATCIGVIAHNPVTKATGIVHVVSDGAESYPSATSQQSLEQMLSSVSGADGSPIEARIIGGHIGSTLQDGILNHIADMLAEYDATLLSADTKGKPGPKNVAVHSARWDEGIIRGGVDMVDFMGDPDTGGMAEMIRQRQECVDLDDMTWLPQSPNALVYDATKSDGPDLEHSL